MHDADKRVQGFVPVECVVFADGMKFQYIHDCLWFNETMQIYQITAMNVRSHPPISNFGRKYRNMYKKQPNQNPYPYTLI
jgi:hypothetical protein